MRVLRISTCGQCPIIVRSGGGTTPVCGHPSVMVTRPYAEKRRVDAEGTPPEFCLLSEEMEEDFEVTA